jgi:hypothetical protein
MYPTGELGKLAARKELLQARIAFRREEARVSVERLTRPVAVLDEWLERWRRVSPLAKVVGVPVALVAFKKLAGLLRGGRWAMAARFLPAVIQAARAFADSRR